MLGERFRRAGNGEKFGFICAIAADNGGDLGFAFRYRSCFVEYHDISLVRYFKRFAVAYQYAVRSAETRADHDGCRRGKSECAGAGYDEHRSEYLQNKGDILARDSPDYRRRYGDGYDCRHENACHLIGCF